MMKKLICIVAAMVMLCAGAQAASIKQAWMEYEDCSGARLGVDYQRFWEIFGGVKTGMGFDASDVFEW